MRGRSLLVWSIVAVLAGAAGWVARVGMDRLHPALEDGTGRPPGGAGARLGAGGSAPGRPRPGGAPARQAEVETAPTASEEAGTPMRDGPAHASAPSQQPATLGRPAPATRSASPAPGPYAPPRRAAPAPTGRADRGEVSGSSAASGEARPAEPKTAVAAPSARSAPGSAVSGSIPVADASGAGGEQSGGGDGGISGGTGPAGAAAAPGAVSPQRAPRLTPPRVLAVAGTGYPQDAFRLTLRRQELGTGLVVEAAEGTVVLRVLVAADGAVRSVDVVTSSGSQVLDRAAEEAVRRWQFAPATRDGVPIDAYAVLRVRYVVR